MKEKVQPYSVLSVMISSPGLSSVHIVAEIAPMPEAVQRPASAPSRLAIRDSSSATVGLEMRE